jgi:hypothetical protein
MELINFKSKFYRYFSINQRLNFINESNFDQFQLIFIFRHHYFFLILNLTKNINVIINLYNQRNKLLN